MSMCCIDAVLEMNWEVLHVTTRNPAFVLRYCCKMSQFEAGENRLSKFMESQPLPAVPMNHIQVQVFLVPHYGLVLHTAPALGCIADCNYIRMGLVTLVRFDMLSETRDSG